MYIPKKFINTDMQSVKEFIDKNGFGILVSNVNGRPWATHIPLMLLRNEDGEDILVGHISKGNKQWKNFGNCEEVLVIFQGPHAYISSSWYDHENVPTWNYVAVHVYGKLKIVEGDLLKEHLSKVVDKYEVRMDYPISVEKMSEDFFNKEVKGIVGFEIEVTEIQAASKLSQNRDAKNYAYILNGLKKLGDKNSLEIANLMEDKPEIKLRQASVNDIAEIQNIFADTIRKSCCKDYSEKEIDVWISLCKDKEKWIDKINNQYFLVACIHNQIVGYCSLENGNHIDLLYVHKNYQRIGVATKLYNEIEEVCRKGYNSITSDVSITALPYFKEKGFKIIKRNVNYIKGIELINYEMQKIF